MNRTSASLLNLSAGSEHEGTSATIPTGNIPSGTHMTNCFRNAENILGFLRYYNEDNDFWNSEDFRVIHNNSRGLRETFIFIIHYNQIYNKKSYIKICY